MGRPSPRFPQPSGSPRHVFFLCLALIAAVFCIYGQTLGFGFVNCDDPAYVYDNPHVCAGLTWDGFVWAVTYGDFGHWHPLTWLSHMLDVQVWGLNAGGHHLTSVLLHAANVVLLFLVLRRMTGTVWRSAFVAALFAVHPLRVESVVWISDRKDMLAGFFFMLVLWLYEEYIRRPSRRRYAVLAVVFVLGLLSKSMLVMVPFVLLLLDVWPLRRIGLPLHGETLRKLVWEKVPLFALSAASCIATLLAPEVVEAHSQWTLPVRLENAVVSCGIYLWQMLWPTGLVIPALNPGWSLGQIVLAASALAALSAGVWILGKRHPWLPVGWLWYLSMLMPVLGIVQFSYHSHADRYTYLPQIGIGIMVVWGAAALAASRRGRWIVGILGVAWLFALLIAARVQCGHWRNGEALWTHVLAEEPDNPYAHVGLAQVREAEGRVPEAVLLYRKALELKPQYAAAHNNLGCLSKNRGAFEEALWHYREAIRLEPEGEVGHANMANLLLAQGNYEAALAEGREALRLNSRNPTIRNTLGAALTALGRDDEALEQYREAVRLDPRHAHAQANLGNALLARGEAVEAVVHARLAMELSPGDPAIAHNTGKVLAMAGLAAGAEACYREAIRLWPDYAEAQGSLANLLMVGGDVDGALEHYRIALRLQPQNAAVHSNHGVALASRGGWDEAAREYREAIRLDPNYAQPWKNLGDLLVAQKKISEARKCYEEALKLDPGNVRVKEALAKIVSEKR